MAKWFSFNQKDQRVEEIVPTEEIFNSPELLFWSRGMVEWQFGPNALEFFLNSPIHDVVQPQVVTPVVEEKKQTIGPFYKKETSNTVIVVEKNPEPVVVITQKYKPVLKKVKKQALQKKTKKSKPINFVIKKKKIKSKNKAVKLKKNKNRRKREN